ncbi:MAG: bile acid:sodium symporter family protein [Alphaproteobacteria bacterium]|nr:bile acid:sodium symporter family protein [Alphaproteobacteria bacterium SS10]
MGLVVDIFLPLALAFIMFALGIGLTVEDFTWIARQPRDFLIGAASQMILLPLVAFTLVTIWPMDPKLALGLVIIAAAPGGVTSNILTSFARGDVALSISLTAVTSLLTVITIPLIVTAAYTYLIGDTADQDISVTKTALSVFAIATLPVLIGLAVRRYATGFALRFEPIARRLSTVLFLIVLAGAIYGERNNIAEYFAQAGLITLTLNIIMMALAFGLAVLFATGPTQRIAISLECGLQNGTLAIAVTTLLFGGGLVTVPAATYSLIMFGTGLAFVAILRRVANKAAETEAG